MQTQQLCNVETPSCQRICCRGLVQVEIQVELSVPGSTLYQGDCTHVGMTTICSDLCRFETGQNGPYIANEQKNKTIPLLLFSLSLH